MDNTPLGATYPEQDSALIVYGIDSTGYYFYKAVITDTSSGCVTATSDSVRLTVAQQPVIINQSGIQAPICADGASSVYVTASGGAPNIQYNWQYFNNNNWITVDSGIPNGAVYRTVNSDSLTVSQIDSAGSYSYRCIISATGNGCSATIGNITTITTVPAINIVTEPVAQLQSCVNGTVTTGLLANGGTPSLAYNWQVDSSGTWVSLTNGVSYNIARDTVTVTGINTPGLYKYRCMVSAGGNGCVPVTSVSVNYHVYSNPTVTLTTGNADLCVGDILQITRTESGAPSDTYALYSSTNSGSTWQVTSDTGSLISIPFSTAGQVEYKMTVSSSLDGCISETSPTLLVNTYEIPATPMVGFDSSGICNGSVKMPFAILNSDSNYHYEWTIFPAENILLDNLQGSVAEISFDTAVQHTLTVKCNINGLDCYSYAILPIKVNATHGPGDLDIVLTEPGNNLFCVNDTLLRYVWGYDSKGNDESFTVSNGPSALYSFGSTFDTLRNAYWAYACSSDMCCTKQYFNAPNTYTSLESLENDLIELYPNPTSGTLIFRNNSNDYKNCDIFSVQGRFIKNIGGCSPGSTMTFNIADLAPGSYLVVLSNMEMQDITLMKMIVLIK